MTIAARGWGGDRGELLTGISPAIMPHPTHKPAVNAVAKAVR
jgi:hypothetical protein